MNTYEKYKRKSRIIRVTKNGKRQKTEKGGTYKMLRKLKKKIRKQWKHLLRRKIIA
jgi:hypothetical protein